MYKSAFRGEVKNAQPHPYVQAALNGDPRAAKIVTPLLNSKCVTPNDKFNAVTAAMQLIRFKPERQLIKKPITEIYEPGSLENILTTILNHTLERQSPENYAHVTENPRPLYNDDTRDYCHEAEINFLHSALKQNQSRNKIYVQDNGEPVFFKKFFPRGVASALTLQPVSFAGIELPPGSIVDLKEKHSARYMPNSGSTVVGSVKDSRLTAAYPLRLSSFALNDKDRYETFGSYNQRGAPLSEIERQTTVKDIQEWLPQPAQLAARLLVNQEVSDMHYAA